MDIQTLSLFLLRHLQKFYFYSLHAGVSCHVKKILFCEVLGKSWIKSIPQFSNAPNDEIGCKGGWTMTLFTNSWHTSQDLKYSIVPIHPQKFIVINNGWNGSIIIPFYPYKSIPKNVLKYPCKVVQQLFNYVQLYIIFLFNLSHVQSFYILSINWIWTLQCSQIKLNYLKWKKWIIIFVNYE